jgi:hypothetical protein
MAAAEYLDMDEDYQKLVMKWMAAGHEVIHERRVFRHRTYKKDFPSDQVIKRNGIPFITDCGHKLTFGDVFPERADLALDMNGCVVSQEVFTTRYKEYLGWFQFTENSDLDAEFIPDVNDYLSQTYDTFSDSKGFVQIGYDARKPAEIEATHLYDPRNDQMVEITKNQELTAQVLQSMLDKLTQPDKNGPKRVGA